MLSNSVLATAVLIALARAAPLPLNINLGAYSPALVVGDGAMSFEEANAVTNIVNSLQGAASAGGARAAGTAGAATAPAPAAAAPQASPAPQAAAGTTNAASSSPILSEAAGLPIGMGKEAINPRAEEEAPKVSKRQSGFDRALTFAEAALTKGPKVNLGTGKEGGSGVGIVVQNSPTAGGARTVG